MRKEDITKILIVVLIILGIIFLINYYVGDNSNITGMAGPGLSGPCPCGDGTEPGDCSVSESHGQPYYCYSEYDPVVGEDVCYLQIDCQECGCPSGKECQGGGQCTTPSNGGGGSTEDCKTNDDCGSSKVCLNGNCEKSENGDGICAYSGLDNHDEYSETCENNSADCEGIRANCENYNICNNGECVFDEQYICGDGTQPGECSNELFGGYCQIENETAILRGSCAGKSGVCPCPENYNCTETGFCEEIVEFINETEECIGDDCLIQESPIIENYCEYYGGICSDSCDENHYEINESDYTQLNDDCKAENSEFKCCYPYSNDEINDCEYYGGSCLNSCENNYYHAETPYLDQECEYYTNSNSLCCISYNASNGEEFIEETISETGIYDILFGTQKDDVSSESKNLELQEIVSLNREISMGIIVLFVAIIFLIYYKKRKK